MPDEGYKFDLPAVRRIVKTVRAVARKPTKTGIPKPHGLGSAPETIVARLTGTSGSGFQWEEVYRDNAGDFQAKENGRTHTAGLAYDFEPGLSSVGPLPVLLRRSPVTNGDEEWVAAWLIVPRNDGDLFLVGLEEDGGADGDGDSEPTYTYTVTRNGQELGTEMGPEEGRTEGTFTAATRGIGYYTADRTFHLLQAYERPATYQCEETPPP